MTRALWLLLWLSWRAKIRNGWRGMATPRRALFSLFGLGINGVALFLPLFLQLSPHYWSWRIDPILVAEGFSSLLTFTLIMGFLMELRGRALSFTGPEGDFLFPAPFTRRQLLIYK